MKNTACLVLLALTLLAMPSAQASDYTSSGFIVRDPVITVGGGISSSSGFQLFSSVGQSATGENVSASFTQRSGFLYFPAVTSPIISATAGSSQVALTWTASSTALGFSVSGYQVGRATVSGGPYTLTPVGNVLSSTVTGLTNGTPYFFTVNTLDAFGSVIVRSAEVSATPTGGGGGSGGGGSGGGSGRSGYSDPQQSTGVTFIGRAYPNRTVTLLKDAQVVATTVAGPDARFQVTLTGLSSGNYMFSIYSTANGLRSSLLVFPIFVTAGASTTISGIFISPTIEVDKTDVKRGENIAIFGQSYPKADIVIQMNSPEDFFVKTKTDNGGVYLYNFDTSPLDLGEHTTKSKAAQDGLVSTFSKVVGFKVVKTRSEEKELPELLPYPKNTFSKKIEKCGKTDVNCDGKVNLIDFSIVAFWYKRPLSDAFAKKEMEHFNGDGKINLTDFSIMAFYWTG